MSLPALPQALPVPSVSLAVVMMVPVRSVVLNIVSAATSP